MWKIVLSVLSAALLLSGATAAPAATSPPPPSETVALASDDPNEALWNENTTIIPEAIRGSLGATVIGPQNVDIDRQNADLLAPPSTDAGTVANAKWPFGLSHNRLQTGGWARQQNTDTLPIATSMAGVNMRLEAGAIRELHWHLTAEWAFVLKGSVQLTAVNMDGQNFLDTVGPGDLWYFPPGIPHSLQATNDSADGAEFLLVFDNGAFSEDDTLLLTDWMAHVPKEVIAKNFGTTISAFDNIPGQQLYIFPSVPPADDTPVPDSPQGQVQNPFTFKLSQTSPRQLAGGTVKIVDSRNFTVATAISAAEVTVEPGGLRFWHPTQDEWTYYISGEGRVTVFAAQGNARTFNYEAGDVGFVPASFGHFVENIGNDTLHFLEISNSNLFQDVSLNQWLALTPPELVKAHLGLSDETISHFSKTKQIVVGPS
ncbi:hypothetical protein CERSUDRAFT_163165 [Gelatoporia subvermispora B]|uniref:Cupin type-1 domain-containing protein n=1 Tax=Ceriporiopsis subvermispora (strain B) TaxID=914234 RepID=M2P7J7_CERS8|nr:hypothetical protein CERSUDRAFT_163165 [Gelatoporia subvermispora B]